MAEVVVIPNEILNVLIFLSVLGIIAVFLAKLYNILHRGKEFTIQMSTILLAIGMICFLFIEVGLLINVPVVPETSLLEFNFYNWFSRIFIVMVWIFYFIELLLHTLYVMEETANGATRMAKRRFNRFNIN